MSYGSRPHLYPILFALFPALALLATNIGQVRLDAVVRPLVVSFVVAVLLYGFLWAVLRDRNRAALLTTVMLLLFFSYGHVYELLKGSTFLGLSIGRHRVLFPIWVILVIAGTWAIARQKVPEAFTSGLSLVFSIVIVIALVEIASFEVRSYLAQRQQALNKSDLAQGTQALVASGSPPDIYYIILDGYARHDVMLNTYGFDNSEFLSDLTTRGFAIAQCSLSNYNHTDLSLASSLNFEYVDQLYSPLTADPSDRTWLPPFIRNSRLRSILEELGYEVTAFQTGYPVTEITDADTYLAPASFSRSLLSGITGFESLFLRSTAASFLVDTLGALWTAGAPLLDGGEDWRRNHVLFTLNSLERIASARGPKFVFAHIVSPHEPFVLGPLGEFVSSPPLVNNEYSEEHFRAYAAQAMYLSSRIIDVIDVLLSTTGTPPVIILQADHRPDFGGSRAESYKILNAYFYPDAHEQVYSTITPVNTFRLVLNSLFGTDYQLKEDESYSLAKDDFFAIGATASNCGN